MLVLSHNRVPDHTQMIGEREGPKRVSREEVTRHLRGGKVEADLLLADVLYHVARDLGLLYAECAFDRDLDLLPDLLPIIVNVPDHPRSKNVLLPLPNRHELTKPSF